MQEIVCLLYGFIAALSMEKWMLKGIYREAKSHFQKICNGKTEVQHVERWHVFGIARSANVNRAASM